VHFAVDIQRYERKPSTRDYKLNSSLSSPPSEYSIFMMFSSSPSSPGISQQRNIGEGIEVYNPNAPELGKPEYGHGSEERKTLPPLSGNDDELVQGKRRDLFSLMHIPHFDINRSTAYLIIVLAIVVLVSLIGGGVGGSAAVKKAKDEAMRSV
jgi:hypothetical protein